MNLQVRGAQKRKKGIETASRILEVSSDLFARKGYDGVSVHEIAEAVGIKESSVYNHFKSKAAILDALFELFIEKAPEARPADQELDRMLMILTPEEIFKNIVFYFGSHQNITVENTAMVINNEKYKNPRAAQVYRKHVVDEPSAYFEHLIEKMAALGKVKKVDAKMFAQQYNYVSLSLTKEYFMAKNGLADMRSVVGYMVKTIEFFCNLMKE